MIRPKIHSQIRTVKRHSRLNTPKRAAADQLFAVQLEPRTTDRPELITFRKTPELEWLKEIPLYNVRFAHDRLTDKECIEVTSRRYPVIGRCNTLEIAMRYADFAEFQFKGDSGDYNFSIEQARIDFDTVQEFASILANWLS